MAGRFTRSTAKNAPNLDPLWSQLAEDRVHGILKTAPKRLEKLFLVSVFAGFGLIYVLFFTTEP